MLNLSSQRLIAVGEALRDDIPNWQSVISKDAVNVKDVQRLVAPAMRPRDKFLERITTLNDACIAIAKQWKYSMDMDPSVDGEVEHDITCPEISIIEDCVVPTVEYGKMSLCMQAASVMLIQRDKGKINKTKQLATSFGCELPPWIRLQLWNWTKDKQLLFVEQGGGYIACGSVVGARRASSVTSVRTKVGRLMTQERGTTQTSTRNLTKECVARVPTHNLTQESLAEHHSQVGMKRRTLSAAFI